MIVVTHDLGLVAEICDEVLVMYGGMISEYSTSDNIFNNPQNPYTQGLLKAFPDIDHPKAELSSIPGTPPRLDNLPPGCRFEPRCRYAWDLCKEKLPQLTKVAPNHFSACHLASREKEL